MSPTLKGGQAARVLWSSGGRGTWPSTPAPGQLDEAADLLVRLALFDRPDAVRMVRLRYGLGPHAGRAPITEPVAAAAVGWAGRVPTEVALTRLREAARNGGPPASLLSAVAVITEALPATAPLLALLLREAGCTAAVLDPRSVVALAALWGVPAPRLHLVRRRAGSGEVLLCTGRRPPVESEAVAETVRRAGALPLTQALRLPGWPKHWDERRRLDLLGAWELHQPGSPVVWDQRRPGRLLRPVQRLLAACGPLPPADVLAGLRRARHATPRLEPGLPDPGTLLGWAAEHPGLAVDGGQLKVRPAGSDEERLLTPADRVLVAALRGRPAGARTAELLRLLVAAGCSRSRDAASTILNLAPYVVPVVRGTVALRRPSTGATRQASAGPGSVPTVPGVPTLLTLEEVADELAVSRSQVYALVRRRDLPALKIGGKGAWRVERTALDLWLQKVRDDTARWLRDNPW